MGDLGGDDVFRDGLRFRNRLSVLYHASQVHSEGSANQLSCFLDRSSGSNASRQIRHMRCSRPRSFQTERHISFSALLLVSGYYSASSSPGPSKDGRRWSHAPFCRDACTVDGSLPGCRTNFGSIRLVKLHSNQDEFTELQGHPSIVRRQRPLANRLLRTVRGLPCATPCRNLAAPTRKHRSPEPDVASGARAESQQRILLEIRSIGKSRCAERGIHRRDRLACRASRW